MLNDGQVKWYIDQLTAPQMLNRNILKYGHRTAQMWRNGKTIESVTWKEVGEIVSDLSCGLMDLGIEKGDRVAIMSNTRAEWLWCDYSILCAGGITVCIYPTLSDDEMTYILNDSGTKIIYVETEEHLEKALGIKKDVPTLEKIVVMNENFTHSSPDVMNLSDVAKLGILYGAKDRFAYEKRWKSVEIYDRMTIVYTSGTTGRPKGAVHTHLSFNAACCRDHYIVPSWSDDDLLLSFLPLSHTYERECGHGTAMLCGGSIAYSNPKTLVDDLAIFKPTVFMSVPRIYERVYMTMKEQAAGSAVKKFLFNAAINTGIKVINERADENGFIDMSEDLELTDGIGFFLKLKFKLFDKLIFSKVREKLGGRLRFAMSAAGSLPADLCKSFLAMGVRVMEGYGATETMNAVNCNVINKMLPGSVGPLNKNVYGRIADDGEWLVKGSCIFLEYWNNPEATEKAFSEDGYYKTGDIVEMVADGYIKIVDRKGGLMVLDTGKNVSATKIESRFSLSPYIDVVFPIASERKFVTALVVPNLDTFINYFDENGISYDKSALVFEEEGGDKTCIQVGEDFVENVKLKEIISAEIEKVNKTELEEYESIKKFKIITKRFTEKTNEMTPTLKVKRRIVMKNYEKEIDSLYS